MNTIHELSLWNDVVKVATVNEQTVRYFDEQKGMVLAADNMRFEGAAFNIELLADINGTNTLSFDIPMKYYDLTQKKLIDNPLFAQCSNERKVKLLREEEWYTFVIKTVKEDSITHIAQVEAADICTNELSKNGYGLTFDNELYGNDGELNELAAMIMDKSAWTYIPVNTEAENSPSIDLTECKDELLYQIVKLKSDAPAAIECECISTDAHPAAGTLTLTTDAGVITNSGEVFFFYSDIITEDNEVEAIYISDAIYQQLLSSDYDDIEKVEMIQTLGTYIYIPSVYVSSSSVDITLADWTVRKIVKSQKRFYSDEIGQMLYAYRGPENNASTDYWGYIESSVTRNETTLEYEWTYTNHYYQLDTNPVSLTYNTLRKDEQGEIIAWSDTDGTFIPSYRGYSKIRTLNESKSNRFNLMQTLAESFEVWVTYIINYDATGKILRDPTDVTRAQKYITFRQSNAQVNNIGFTYGVNLQKISRSVESSEIATKVFVEPIDNGALENGICAIQSARENFSGENYTLNFDYYIKQGIVNATELHNDLYNVSDGYLGLLVNLHNYNQKLDLLNTAIIQLSTDIVMNREILDRTQDSIKAIAGNYNDNSVDIVGPATVDDVLAENGTWRDKLLKIYKSGAESVQAITLPIRTVINRYDSFYVSLEYIPQNISDTDSQPTWYKWKLCAWTPDGTGITLTPEDVANWTVGCILTVDYTDNYSNAPSTMTLSRIQTLEINSVVDKYYTLSAENDPIPTIADQPIRVVVEVSSIRNPDFPMSVDMIAGVLNEAEKMAALDELYNQWRQYKQTYQATKPDLEAEITERENLISGNSGDNLNTWTELKSNLLQNFENKYSRFISEGTWSDGNYTNADSYYLDALKVSYTSGRPKVSYTLTAADLSVLTGYELFKFKPGDVTYIEDPEYFGYTSHGTPYRERVVISKIKYNLLNPSENEITLQNYMTQFEDLFQRISASVQSYNFNENIYNRAGNFSATDMNSRILQNTLLNNNFVLLQSPDNSIIIDKKGVYLTDSGNNNNRMKIMSNGIMLSTDGGRNWTTGLTSQGLTADLITSGTINTSKINLFGGASAPGFSWDIRGINAFAYTREANNSLNINYSRFVRFDQYGLYLADLEDGQPSTVFDNGLANSADPVSWIQNQTKISITWNGFYMNTDEGSVRIDPEKDIQVMAGAVEKVRIGWYPVNLADETGDGGYGISVRDGSGNFIFHTGMGAESAIYLPQLVNATGTEYLVFVDANGKLFKSNITYAQIDALVP